MSSKLKSQDPQKKNKRSLSHIVDDTVTDTEEHESLPHFPLLHFLLKAMLSARSEERRVGKECRP